MSTCNRYRVEGLTSLKTCSFSVVAQGTAGPALQA